MYYIIIIILARDFGLMLSSFNSQNCQNALSTENIVYNIYNYIIQTVPQLTSYQNNLQTSIFDASTMMFGGIYLNLTNLLNILNI